MKIIYSMILALFPLLTALGNNGTQAIEKKQYTANRLTQAAPLIDGRLEESVWQGASRTGGFVQFEPFEGKSPSQETEFIVFYDDNNLYVGIWAWDTSPDSISKRMTRRDEIEGDMVGVDIDSYFDHRTSFGFFVSASGVKLDRVSTSDGSNEDESWDPIWYVGTAISDKGWTAEFRIPLTQLRFSEKDELTWGLNVARMLFRKDELSLWQPMSRNASGSTSFYGEMVGLSKIKARKQTDITPFAVASAETSEKVEGNPYATGRKFNYNGGVDAKIGITNNFTLDLSLNPDFGQVEADPSEVNLTAYETFFREKRPFFIEGRTILSMPLMIGDGDLADENLFYTRRVGRRPQGYPSTGDGEYSNHPEFTSILGAAKLTGKTQSGWSFGLLETVTQNEKAEIDFNGEKRYETVEPLTNYTVGSVHKDFNNGNTVISGLFTATNRKLDDSGMDYLHKSAYTGGFTLEQFFKEKTYMLLVKTYFSDVNGTTDAITRTQMSSTHYYQREDRLNYLLDTTRTSLMGSGGSVFFGKVGNAPLQWGLFLNYKTAGVELNDAGFLRQADNLMPIFWAGYRITEPFWIIRQVNINTNHWTMFDFAGQYLGYGGNINFNSTFKNLWSFGAGLNWDSETIETSLLRGGPAFRTPGALRPWISIESDGRKKFSMEITGYANRNYNGHGEMAGTELEFSYKPINALSLSLAPSFTASHSNLQYIEQTLNGTDDRYIFGTIDQRVLGVSFRVNLTLTPTFTIQYWGQPFFASGLYTDLKYITDPMADEYTDRFQVYSQDQIECHKEESYCLIDENRDGTNDYSISYPDFNVKEFKSNLVLRWEYRPGSVLFLVWSQGRSGYDPYGDFAFGRDFKNLYDITPQNVFLIKCSYRFGL